LTFLQAGGNGEQPASRAWRLPINIRSGENWASPTEKFNAGFSTNFNVIQQQAYLAQSETTEVVALAAWQKAAVQLDRALGQTLQHQGIVLNPDSKIAK
jgi:hypothetical protein